MDISSIPGKSAPAQGIRWAIESDRLGECAHARLEALDAAGIRSLTEEMERMDLSMNDVPKYLNGTYKGSRKAPAGSSHRPAESRTIRDSVCGYEVVVEPDAEEGYVGRAEALGISIWRKSKARAFNETANAVCRAVDGY